MRLRSGAIYLQQKPGCKYDVYLQDPTKEEETMRDSISIPTSRSPEMSLPEDKIEHVFKNVAKVTLSLVQNHRKFVNFGYVMLDGYVKEEKLKPNR